MTQILWVNEVEKIKEFILTGSTIEDIGDHYKVSKQRIYQVMTKFGITTGVRQRKSFLKNKESKYYWFNHLLTRKAIPREERLSLLSTITLPTHCPMLSIELNYDGTGKEGWSRKDDSPSLDRKDNSKGYTKDNIQVISWRANRIKNDSTPEEIMKIALYMQKLT